MNKIILITLVFFSFLKVNAQSKTDFYKKWNLQAYIYWGVTFSPEDNEKNDYLNFFKDGSFSSMDEGKLGVGSWEWLPKSKSLVLKNDKTKESIQMQVVELTRDKMIVLLEDDEDSIKVKFKAAK